VTDFSALMHRGSAIQALIVWWSLLANRVSDRVRFICVRMQEMLIFAYVRRA
jgi:hypothetical protein